MSYDLIYSDDAIEDITLLKRSEPMVFKKLTKLLGELIEHPKSGTGKPEQLRYDLSGKWSRRITDKHRLVYSIDDKSANVLIVNAYGHYKD